jgi:hypothetical protein
MKTLDKARLDALLKRIIREAKELPIHERIFVLESMRIEADEELGTIPEYEGYDRLRETP